MRGHSNGLRRCRAHPNGQLALSASDDGSVRLWNLRDAAASDPPAGHEDAVTACVLCQRRGEMVVVSADSAGNAQCQPAAGEATGTLWRVHVSSVSPSCKAIAALSSCGDATIACAMYQRVVLLSVDDGTVRSKLAFGDWANTCASTDARLLAAAGDAGKLTVWRANATEQVWQDAGAEVLDGMEGDLIGCALGETAESGVWLCAGSNAGEVTVWKVADASTRLFRLGLVGTEQSDWVLSVFMSATVDLDGVSRRLVGATVGGRLGATHIWAVDPQQEPVAGRLELDPFVSRVGVAGGEKGGVVWGGLVDDGSGLPALITASSAKTLHLWRLRPGQKGSLRMVGMFPALGSFGSPDGIGGQAAIAQADGALTLAVGDQSGRMYTLEMQP